MTNTMTDNSGVSRKDGVLGDLLRHLGECQRTKHPSSDGQIRGCSALKIQLIDLPRFYPGSVSIVFKSSFVIRSIGVVKVKTTVLA